MVGFISYYVLELFGGQMQNYIYFMDIARIS